jgi:NAD(P)H-hydrate epimerase
MNKEAIASIIKPRDPLSHKGNYGHALLIAGNIGRMGAAVLASRACLRSGVGLLTVNVPKEERSILQIAIPEAMLNWREEPIRHINTFSTIGIGPALGTSDDELELLKTVLSNYKNPIAIDADALTLLSQHHELWPQIAAGSILTPHPKEFDRLFGEHDSLIARKEKAIQVSLQFDWVIILKGHATDVIYKGACWTNDTGNAGLAKGGSGDVLCGMVTALLSQGYPSFDAAKAAVYLHGLAADIAIKEQPMESLLATDVIESIGLAFATLH